MIANSHSPRETRRAHRGERAENKAMKSVAECMTKYGDRQRVEATAKSSPSRLQARTMRNTPSGTVHGQMEALASPARGVGVLLSMLETASDGHPGHRKRDTRIVRAAGSRKRSFFGACRNHTKATRMPDWGFVRRRGKPRAGGIRKEVIGIHSTFPFRRSAAKGKEVSATSRLRSVPLQRTTTSAVTSKFR